MNRSSHRRQRSARRALRTASTLTALGIAANGLRLRSRAGGLARLPDAGSVDVGGWTTVVAQGVSLQSDTIAAAVAWAGSEGLDAVDIVPADLPTARALDLLRQVDTASFRSDPLVEGRTAGHAIVVRDSIAQRAELPTEPIPPAEMIEAARQVKRFAPRTFDVAVAPSETAVEHDADEQLSVQRTVFDRYGTVNLTASSAELAVLGAGAAFAPRAGLAALGLLHAQPAVVFAGGPGGLSPRDLGSQVAARWLIEARRLLRLMRAHAPAPTSIRLGDELRPVYAKELAQGTDHLFEPRVDECPWCDGHDLSVVVSSPDLIQHKPGTFTLESCGSCGHVFQNPRLTIEGLDLYYRDFYDGFAGDEMEKVFASEVGEYEGRATMIAEHLPSPDRWLDVGSGHAHFCLVAGGHFPDTSFEGVEQSSAIDDAARRGWIDRAHRGLFPEVAPDLAGRFDVVSMLHYLEHTRDPRAELDAAVTALAPGGLLMIELPDPECPSGSTLGPYWMPWLQPQHQHFLSIGRLEQALVERGFTILDRYRAPHTPAPDTVVAAWFVAGQLVPRPWMPWLPRPTLVDRALRMAVCTAGAPLALAAAAVAQVRTAASGSEQPGNAFRVLARYDGAGAHDDDVERTATA